MQEMRNETQYPILNLKGTRKKRGLPFHLLAKSIAPDAEDPVISPRNKNREEAILWNMTNQ